jgi:shikimate dehydrogenase
VSAPPGRPVALIGDPVAHSVSPAIHRAAFAALGLDLDYVVLRVGREELADAFPLLRRTYLGLNVTTPLKEAAIPLLDSLSPTALRAGSVNTVLFGDGSARGMSTDGEGFMAALRARQTPGAWSPRWALILGMGGAARAVAASLLGGRAAVIVSGRNAQAGRRMAADLGLRFVPAEPGPLADAVASADLLVNATPVGGPAGPAASPLPDSVPLHPGLVVFDLVYRPRRTPLLARAEAAGCATVEGIEMLVEQAARSFEIWTSLPAPVEVMREAAYRAVEAEPDPGEPPGRPERSPSLVEERR